MSPTDETDGYWEEFTREGPFRRGVIIRGPAGDGARIRELVARVGLPDQQDTLRYLVEGELWATAIGLVNDVRDGTNADVSDDLDAAYLVLGRLGLRHPPHESFPEGVLELVRDVDTLRARFGLPGQPGT